MTAHDYLAGVLASQALSPREIAALQQLRGEIEGRLRQAYGAAPRFYCGGSYGKGTMVRAAYDLDIVMYFPPTQREPMRDIFNHVNGTLRQHGYIVQPRTVALRLPYEGGFHVDVVPGRAQDATFRYATLYKNPNSWLQTSLKVHIDAVRQTGIRELVQLMKLWRLRWGLSWSTFALETTVGRALRGKRKNDYAGSIATVFRYIVDNLRTARLEDPANTNNEIEMTMRERDAVVGAAESSLSATWEQVIY
jgi:hypothetical protein